MAEDEFCEPPPKRQKLLDKLLDKEETLRLRREYIAPGQTLHYSKVKPLKIVRGRGQYLYDENDQPYLDCINNVSHVSHCHPKVVEAGTKQMAQLSCFPFPAANHDLLQKYSHHLLSTFPEKLDCVLFVSSGSEANDLAFQIAETATGHSELIVVDGAYHGHSTKLMGLSTYKMSQQKNGVQGITPNQHSWIASCPNSYSGKYRDAASAGQQYADEVKRIIDDITSQEKKVAAFMCESFLGCAGQVQLPDGYFKAVYEYVHTAGGLCIADEVQCGFGRGGDYFWVFEAQGVCPDIVTIGKPMANGHPISAVVTTKEIAMKFAEAEGSEALTKYCSDPVSLAMAEAVLTVIEEEGLQAHAKKMGDYFMGKMREMMEKHPCIGDVRGFGLFIGVEFVKDRSTREPNGKLAEDLVHRVLLNHKIMINTDGLDNTAIKIKPPLCFTKEDADNLLQAIEQSLEELGY